MRVPAVDNNVTSVLMKCMLSCPGYDVLADSVIFGVDTFRARPNGEAFLKIRTADERERAVTGLDRKQLGSRYIEVGIKKQDRWDNE